MCEQVFYGRVSGLPECVTGRREAALDGGGGGVGSSSLHGGGGVLRESAP